MMLIDTSAWVEFLRRRGDRQVKQVVAQLLQSADAAYTCPTVFELLSGARTEEEADLELTLRLAEHIAFLPADWRRAALLERQLRRQGATVPRDDLFVAAVAIRAGLPLLCRDTHFDAVCQVAGDRLKVQQV